MKGQPIHAPLSVAVVEVGFSNDPHRQLPVNHLEQVAGILVFL